MFGDFKGHISLFCLSEFFVAVSCIILFSYFIFKALYQLQVDGEVAAAVSPLNNLVSLDLHSRCKTSSQRLYPFFIGFSTAVLPKLLQSPSAGREC